MPWEVSSLLSRLRVRNISHSTNGPPSTNSLPAVPPTAIPERYTEVIPVQPLPTNLKILQDPSSFIDSAEAHPFPRGLTPSTRRHSVDGSNGGTAHVKGRRPRPVSERISEGGEPGFLSLTDSQLVTQSGFVKRLSKTATGGEWSTFGRNYGRQDPTASDFPGRTSLEDTRRGISSSPSLRRIRKSNKDSGITTTWTGIYSSDTLERLTNPSHPSLEARSSSPSSRSPITMDNNKSSSAKSSPTSTLSSRRHPRTPRRPRSYTCPKSDHATTPVTRDVCVDSPHTFGRPTPPDIGLDSSFTYLSPPPPLPPLDHPELAAVISSRSKSTATKQPSLSALSDRSNTLPHTLSGIDEFISSPSLTFGRSIRHHSSFPRIQQNFNTSMDAQHQRPPVRPRARSVSERGQHIRRSSADWSAYQAIAGVNTPSNQAWPAEVSREILRLSLGAELEESLQGSASGPRRVSGSSPTNKTRPRGSNMHDLPDRATTISPSFLPFPPPSRQSYPAPLKEPMTLLDGREPVSFEFSPLQNHDAESRTDGGRATRTMAGVKRSASAVEARNGRKHEATANPSTTHRLKYATTKSALSPRSLHSITGTAASSRTLPPGRYTPRTSLPHFVDAVPSTPTPVSRRLSDNGKGKRKAEDLDVTPPDQKKEGQRATFVLPSENRSQRISSSSHAPSSYHRKRARLSSTSPLTTPAQSRPGSVQEPPPISNSHLTSGSRVVPPSCTPSRAASTRSQLPQSNHRHNHERHQSMSQISIPISALVSPHAPSISRSTKFHMRDPRKPPKKLNDTEWGLRFATEDEPGSPLQAWCFFVGFLVFPIWWVAALLPIPRTRTVGDAAVEKAVTIDDPQIEHDAKTWRFRCRVMTVVSIFTYIPFIVLVAIFVPR